MQLLQIIQEVLSDQVRGMLFLAEQDSGDVTSGNTITNSGTIFSDDQRAINYFF